MVAQHTRVILAAPAKRLFGLLLPAGVDDADPTVMHFRRNGTCFQFHSADQVGLGPLLRIMPLAALAVACALGAALVLTLLAHHQRLAPIEIAGCLALGALVVALIGGVSWLLRDLTQAAIIDARRKILWLGGGWMGRWQALNFSLLARVEVVERDPEAEYPFTVQVVDLDGERYAVCHEISSDIAGRAARELADRLQLSATPPDLATTTGPA